MAEDINVFEDKYKGMGIGSMLLAEWHRLYHNKVDSFLLWIGMDNGS